MRVEDLAGTPLWAAITNQTRIQYGVESLLIPLSLSGKFPISQISPDPTRNEFKFQGIGKNTSYRLIVKAIQTIPGHGDLRNATSISLRSATATKLSAE